MTETKYCIILISAAGGGKSTLALKLSNIFYSLFNTVAWLSTDDYYKQNAVGEYRWNSQEIAKAHSWNKKRFSYNILASAPVIIVDNTNTTKSQYEYYENLAEQNGYLVFFVEPNTPWRYDAEECFRRNSHGVPLQTTKRMVELVQGTVKELRKTGKKVFVGAEELLNYINSINKE